MSVLAQRPVQMVLGVVVALVLFGGGFALGSNAKVAPSGATVATGSTGAAVTRGGAGAARAGGAAAPRLLERPILAVHHRFITHSERPGGPKRGNATTTTA